MDLKDSEQDAAFRDEVRAWLHDTLEANPKFKIDKDFSGTIDDQDWELRIEWEKLLGEAKWLGLSWPVEYGGRGATPQQVLIFQEEYARSGAPARANFFGEGLFAPTLLLFGTEEQKKYYLPKIQTCEHIWCQGYSEPNAGSDLANAKTKGVFDQETGEWVINGQKTWSTLAHKANMCFVVTKTDPDAAKPQAGMSFLLVEMGEDNGVEVRPIKQITGAHEFNEIFFSDTRTSEVLGEVGNGWKVAMATLGFERATAFLDQQAMFHKNFARLVEIAQETGATDSASIRDAIVKSYVGLQTLKLTAMRMLPEIVKPGEPIGPKSSIGKLIWTTWYKEFGELVSEVLGAQGMVVDTSKDHRDELIGLSKVPLDSLGPSIFAGTTQIQKGIVGDLILGLPR